MPRGVYKRTEEHSAAISAAKRGRPRPDMLGDGNPMRRSDVRERVAAAQRGRLRTTFPTYSTVHHERLPKARGRASDHSCIDCGGQAAEWSYREPTGYSADPFDYDPRCRLCHERHDHPREDG
jgi:hypothetical protein